MPASLCWIQSGIDWGRLKRGEAFVEAARAEGDFPWREFRNVLSPIGGNQGGLNAGHVYGLDATRERSLSEGMALGRRIAADYERFLRKYVPGYKKSRIACTAALMGVRETRRIVGEFELVYADYIAGRHFPDQVGVFNKEVDIHVYSDDPAAIEAHRKRRESRVDWLKPAQSYGIPYGILVPRGWGNLWVPGRSVSCDVAVQGSVRVMPAAAMMGEAAGTAAHQAIERGERACALDTAELVRRLRAGGANLPQGELSKEMTRSE
jgi:hypothetical protein